LYYGFTSKSSPISADKNKEDLSVQSTMDNPARPVSQQWHVAVNSIGHAGISMVAALRKALPLTDQEIAKRLLQAPSILAENLSRSVAEQMAALLDHAGLDVALVAADEDFSQGSGAFEVSLSIQDFSRVYDVLQSVMELTGIDVDQAIRLINSVPSVLLANISENNASVLRDRFAPLGVDVDVSKPSEAIYDVFLHGDSYRSQQEFTSLARSLKVDIAANADHSATTLVGLSYDSAQTLWKQATERRIQCRMLNRAYQRYDVRLDRSDAKDIGALSEVLTDGCGIPKNIIPKLVRLLPITVATNVTLAAAQQLIRDLDKTGARAVAELTASLSFNLEFNELTNAEQVQPVLESIGYVSGNKAREVLKGKRKTVEGPFSYPQARWMVSELKKLDCKVSMKKR
jgi:ribosomal protein L7/L12